MTSRQPGITPPGHARMTGETGAPGDTGTPGTGWRAGTEPRWPVLVLPLTLLIILGLAGLHGALTEPRWDGPLRRDGVVVGLALEVVLGVLLVITVRRRTASTRAGAGAALSNGVPGNAVADKLRGVLIFVLGGGMVAVAVVILIGLHLHVYSLKPSKLQSPPRQRLKLPSPRPQGQQGSSTFHLPLAFLLYGLLVVVLVAAIVLSLWWARRFQSAGHARKDDFIAEDSEDLREAVESGRSALRTIDDARAAIIACYLAMEASLAERGTARAIADTPDELLARARATGIVRGTAAARLTALFYEARFSSHPPDHRQRDAAQQALDELAVALAQTEAEPGGGQPGGGQPGGGQPGEAGPGAGPGGGRQTGAGAGRGGAGA